MGYLGKRFLDLYNFFLETLLSWLKAEKDMRYMDNKKKAVDYRFKLLYAIGIITVVSGHCNGGGLSLWND